MTPAIITPDSVTIYVGSTVRTIPTSDPNYAPIMDHLKNIKPLTDEELLNLLNPVVALRSNVRLMQTDRIEVTEDGILIDGEVTDNYLTRKIMDFTKQGLPFEPLVRFYDRLLANPSRTAINELYLWLEQANMPITEDGHFLAYKKVRDDYLSFHDGRTDNSVGQVLEMPRNKVDDVRDRVCSYGFHFCSYTYLDNFYGREGRVVVLKIDPADVVSIPSDYNNAKGRACRYEVISEIEQDHAGSLLEQREVVQSSVSDNMDIDNIHLDYDFETLELTFVDGTSVTLPFSRFPKFAGAKEYQLYEYYKDRTNVYYWTDLEYEIDFNPMIKTLSLLRG